MLSVPNRRGRALREFPHDQDGEKDLLAYLVDAGDIEPDGDLEAQFLEWYQAGQDQVSGEVHYKAILEAARVRQRSFDRGYQAGCAAILGAHSR